MLWRFSVFSLFLLAGGGAGWWLGDVAGALVGVVAASVGWFVFDLLRGTRVLAWLRRADPSSAPVMNGLWGEVADRTRRALRVRDKQTRDAAARLEEFLAAIQASPNGVVLLDSEGRIEWCNAMAAQQFGFDPQRDLQQLIGNLVRDPGFAAYYAKGDFQEEIGLLGRESSAARPIKLSVQLHPYGEGRKLLLTRDVTALEQADVMRRDFVANVSHEIRTPLTVLAGFVETLQTLPLEAQERAHYLGLMAKQALRMQTLVNDLLTLSRLEGSPLPGTHSWTSVQQLMAQCEQEATALVQALPDARGQRLSFIVDGEAELSGVPSELFSAMSNLVSNAVRYTPAKGRIDVRWQLLAHGRAEFSVTDTGPGIASEHVVRITERFYRVDRSRSRETGGTGLGLAIVKHVLQRHGAELRIDSALGKGSTFTIVFPAARVRPVSSAH